MIEYLCLLVTVLRAAVSSRSALTAENLLLRQQLAVLTRPTRKRPRLRSRDKLFWLLVRLVRRDWRRHLVLVTPDTVVRWHRCGWALFWRWRSRVRPGHPRLSAETRELIARIARENPSWGAVYGETENGRGGAPRRARRGTVGLAGSGVPLGHKESAPG